MKPPGTRTAIPTVRRSNSTVKRCVTTILLPEGEAAAVLSAICRREILLTSMDRDGTRAGFDCDLTAAVAGAVQIPVIASGGAGEIRHFVDVFGAGRADAALAASIFHFGVHSARELKQALGDAGVPVRWPC